MVHALKRIHDLLQPGGRLIDIHPTDKPRPIEVVIAGESFLAGWLREANDFETYIQADEAIAVAVDKGWFAREYQQIFTYIYHAQTIEGLRNYMAEISDNAIVDDIVVMRANDLMKTAVPDLEVVMTTPVLITRLRPRPGNGPEASG